MPYYFRGGAERSIRFLAEALSDRGHTCHVVAPAIMAANPKREEFLADLQRRGAAAVEVVDGDYHFGDRGVELRAIWEVPELPARLRRSIEGFAPELIL